jgi:hypothetical protein
MKNTFITTNLIVGSVALYLVSDTLFWHLLGLYWYKGLASMLYRDWFWLGLSFTLLASPFAVWSVRGHWKSSRLLGQFIWCCLLVAGYFVVFTICAYHE